MPSRRSWSVSTEGTTTRFRTMITPRGTTTTSFATRTARWSSVRDKRSAPRTCTPTPSRRSSRLWPKSEIPRARASRSWTSGAGRDTSRRVSGGTCRRRRTRTTAAAARSSGSTSAGTWWTRRPGTCCERTGTCCGRGSSISRCGTAGRASRSTLPSTRSTSVRRLRPSRRSSPTSWGWEVSWSSRSVPAEGTSLRSCTGSAG
mmetsp:Transcript_12232/g.25917  ORF Transcript_12232/g.25917 Transcript_12232/m.25917 type:complete len:203 (-) Transcript_12232:1171-1779(-)